MAGPLVLAGEEAAQFCATRSGFWLLSGGGVPGTVQHYSSRVWQDPAEPVERGGEVAGTPGAAEQEDLAGEPPESLQRSGRAVDCLRVVRQGGDEFARGLHAVGRRPVSCPLDGEVQGGTQGGAGGSQRITKVRSAVALSTVTSAAPGLPAVSCRWH